MFTRNLNGMQISKIVNFDDVFVQVLGFNDVENPGPEIELRPDPKGASEGTIVASPTVKPNLRFNIEQGDDRIGLIERSAGCDLPEYRNCGVSQIAENHGASCALPRNGFGIRSL